MRLLSVLVLALVASTTSALAQSQSLKDQLVGAWSVVSASTTRPDGSLQWGSNPKGLLIFTPNGQFASQLMRADRPKFASNNRLTGTADENKAAMQGTVANYGTYTVDEAKKTYTLRYQGSTYPNIEGTESTRPFVIAGDQLTVTNPAPTAGGPASQLVYKRIR